MKKLLLILLCLPIIGFGQDTSILYGCFSGDCKNGFGEYRFPNGDIYEGNWCGGLMQGEGTYTSFDGTMIKSFWENGLDNSGKLTEEQKQQLYTTKEIFVNECYEHYEEIEIEIEEEDDEEFFIVVENMPEFPGGDLGLMKYIQNNVKYPAIAKQYNITGKVYVSFIVDKKGSVTNVKIVRGVDKNLDAEAMRVVKSLPKYKPAKQRGEPVAVQFTIPINFSLDGFYNTDPDYYYKEDHTNLFLDDDNDGIVNYLDHQVNSPEGSIVDENGIYLSMPVKSYLIYDRYITLKDTMDKYIDYHLDLWLVRDEFEKTIDYQSRTSIKNIEIKKEILFKEIEGVLANDFIDRNITDMSDFFLSSYYADNEIFSLLIRNGLDIEIDLHVPISFAQSFKIAFSDRWSRTEYNDYPLMTLKNIQLSVREDLFELSYLQIRFLHKDKFVELIYDKKEHDNFKLSKIDFKTYSKSVIIVKGCTDKDALNFNSAANKDDGSCSYTSSKEIDIQNQKLLIEEYHVQAEIAMTAKNYELALEYYNKANMEEIESKKWCCMKMNSKDEHKTEYQGNPDTYLSMAMLYVQANDLETAIQSTTAFINLFTLDDEALSMMYFIRGLAWSKLLVDPRYSEIIKTEKDKEDIQINKICYNIQISCSMGYKEACDWPYDDCK